MSGLNSVALAKMKAELDQALEERDAAKFELEVTLKKLEEMKIEMESLKKPQEPKTQMVAQKKPTTALKDSTNAGPGSKFKFF
jgi:regulator of replication initiation timing